MPKKSSGSPASPAWHPSLKKTFKGAELWWQNNMVKKESLTLRLATLQADLDATGQFRTSINTFYMLGHTYAMQACTPESIRDPGSWAPAFSYAVAFRAMDFRRQASLSLPIAEQTVFAFWASMKAAGPAMVLHWETAEVLAGLLVDIAEKDLRVNPNKKDGWRRGTNDAFLVYLFAEAFSIRTSYGPMDLLKQEYRDVLTHWRTTDISAFAGAMSAAADFHISRSRDGTEKTTYEFETSFDRIYPAELLAVQALRRREGLPEFETGHLLIDTPWSLIRDMPDVEPHPLAIAALARLKADYPDFR
ncbi:hypothetical protein [Lysobacter sp. CA199]|uniref:hypothetical protein n=1 Tax=Lysobacter sp. CA199 TaxID=3455608 RepID=UPI003F8CF948